MSKGQVVVVLEAMKMEYPINAPVAGQVSLNSVPGGDSASLKQVLLSITTSWGKRLCQCWHLSLALPQC